MSRYCIMRLSRELYLWRGMLTADNIEEAEEAFAELSKDAPNAVWWLTEVHAEYRPQPFPQQSVVWFNTTQSDAEPEVTRFPTESYRKHIQSLQEVIDNE